MEDLNKLKPLSPMKLDLDDPRNHFIVQLLKANSKVKLEQESLEDAAAVLEFKNNLVGELLLRGEPTGFIIDLKDPRNLHLLRQINPFSATSQIHSPLQSNISPRMPLKSSASPRSSEIKEPTILHKVSKEEFLSFFGYLLKTHTLPEVTNKLKTDGNKKATRTYVDQLSKGMWQNDYPDTFSQLQRLYPEEYKKWGEKK
jgi:HEPN domain-containing protein